MRLDHICFVGTPQFAVPVLDALVNTCSGSRISVISMPDKPRGRHQKTSPSPVKKTALHHQLPVASPTSKEAFADHVQTLNPDIIIVVAYGRIIPKNITDTYFCINIHSSLLPQYRGASPIHTALLNGDTKTGVTIIRMNERMDEGPILKTAPHPIQEHDNLATLTQALSQLGAETCASFINDLYKRPQFPTGTPQNHHQACYTKKITPTDLELSLPQSPVDIHNKVRAYAPKPGVYVIDNGKRIKLIETEIIDDQLYIRRVQPEGKPIMAYHDFLQGYPKGISL
ncbi:MAG: methionyl-tRNA formyltransferase [Candidatus Marinamargulisbacteria bacterium]